MGTAQWEKRSIATDIPVWDPAVCIQCNKCAFVCPHAAIRAKVYASDFLGSAPGTFKWTDYKGAEYKGQKYTIQVAPEDCTGCGLCVAICPAKDKANPKHKAIDMAPQPPIREQERANYEFFLGLPDPDRTTVKSDLKGSQFLRPLFEYSGACSGCGETPYIKLLTQLFGDRTVIANATGCSSIYGANLPTTPYTVDDAGRGPAWANSLFEDNAEFGLGLRLAIDALAEQARHLLKGLSGKVGDNVVTALLEADQSGEAGIAAQRERIVALKQALAAVPGAEAKRLLERRRLPRPEDRLDRRWRRLGLRHRLRWPRPRHVHDPGPQHPGPRHRGLLQHGRPGVQGHSHGRLGQVRRRPARTPARRTSGLMAMTYGHVYVARVAFGAKDVHTLKAFQEAESYHGPSMIIAYSHCIAHGFDLVDGCEQQKLAGRLGHLAALPLRPSTRGGGPAAAAARLGRAQGLAQGLHAQRDALPHGREARSRALQATHRVGVASRRPSLRHLPAARGPHRSEARRTHTRVQELGGDPHGPDHQLPGPEAGPPVHAGRLPARGRARQREEAR